MWKDLLIMNGIKDNIGINREEMNMKYLLFPLLLLAFLCSSCEDKGETVVEVTSFPQVGSLIGAEIAIPTPILLPRYIGVLDNYLFVYKEREENLFALFRLDDTSYIQDVGTRGQGPDEFNLLDTRSFNTTADNNEFTVMEVGSNLLKTVKYDGQRLSVTDSKSIFGQGVSNNGFYALADNMYLTLGRLERDNEFCLLDGKTEELVEKGDYPEWTKMEKKMNTPPLFVPYLKTCVVHPSGKKFAAFYCRFKRLRIYDNFVNLLYDVDVKIPPCSTSFEKPIQEQPVYYIGQPFATDHYIYVLCANSNTGVDQYELQVWNWEGEPLACYRFDRKLSMMTISLKKKKIYALDNQIDSELYIYDLPLLN